MATAKDKDGRKRSKSAASRSKSFYAQALSEAERVLLSEAREIEGLDEEIALLRVKLASALEEHPDNMPLMLRAVDMLVKTVAVRYRLSRKSQENLAEAIDGVLKEVGGALFSVVYQFETKLTISSTVQMWSVIPAAIAGVLG